MDPELAALCAHHGVAAHVAEALDALVAKRRKPSQVATLIEGYEPVDVGGTYQEGPGFEDLATLDTAAIGERYSDLGPIARGGMGEVRRVRDGELNRTLAMKTLHGVLLDFPSARTRFLEEAQTAAQLQHPHIVPIHDIGTLPDGRIWFTMQEVRGRTLTEVIADVHGVADGQWNPTPGGWTFRRVVGALLQVCRAVAFAHDRGVVHRDLKPDNIMVGRHGQTYVLDWGLAKVLGRANHADAVTSTRSGDQVTQDGTVAGTPAYMAPEQARGEVDRIGARTDVYALGAVLYEILSGSRPFEHEEHPDLVARVATEPVMPIDPLLVDGPVPEPLLAACARAMAFESADRFGTADALGDEIEAWLDGARKREEALAIAERALRGVAESDALRARAERLAAEGEAQLAPIERWRPEDDKVEAWAKLDAAAAMRRDADLLELHVDQGLHGALRVAPDLLEAHLALVQRYRDRHAAAEERRDAEACARQLVLLRAHAQALPPQHGSRVAAAAYLEGDGRLTLHTDPPGATVELLAYEASRRRLVEVPLRTLGTTPLIDVRLPMGSYLCRIEAPGRAPVRLPVEITRLGHWDNVAPGASAPTPVWLPPEGAIPADAQYVAAGWSRLGEANRRVWCPGFAMHRFPVTNRQFIAFLDDLVRTGRSDEALRHAPRERGGSDGHGALLYGFDGSRFTVVVDADGDEWLPDYPVICVTWHAARAYLSWNAARTGHPWRLPSGFEWEKAARGVDGRTFPWGDAFDASWCHMSVSHPGPRRLPAVVDSYPVDTSPYGVRGLAGNVYDWCLEPMRTPLPAAGSRLSIADGDRPDDELVWVRGGNWLAPASVCRASRVIGQQTQMRYPNLGFRGVFPVSPPARRGV